MKTPHALFIGLAAGVLIHYALQRYFGNPCPALPVPSSDSATVARQIERDSIEHERRIRGNEDDSLSTAITKPPKERHESSLKVVYSLDRDAQLDTLRADPR